MLFINNNLMTSLSESSSGTNLKSQTVQCGLENKQIRQKQSNQALGTSRAVYRHLGVCGDNCGGSSCYPLLGLPPMSLTDIAIKKAKPAAKPFKLSDSGGLFLIVQPTRGNISGLSATAKALLDYGRVSSCGQVNAYFPMSNSLW